jgi:hypothetical protein
MVKPCRALTANTAHPFNITDTDKSPGHKGLRESPLRASLPYSIVRFAHWLEVAERFASPLLDVEAAAAGRLEAGRSRDVVDRPGPDERADWLHRSRITGKFYPQRSMNSKAGDGRSRRRLVYRLFAFSAIATPPTNDKMPVRERSQKLEPNHDRRKTAFISLRANR